jgi:hypothetical protein
MFAYTTLFHFLKSRMIAYPAGVVLCQARLIALRERNQRQQLAEPIRSDSDSSKSYTCQASRASLAKERLRDLYATSRGQFTELINKSRQHKV